MEDLVLKAVSALKQLEPPDLRVLNAVERGMAHYEIVPVEQIARLSGLSLDEVIRRLGKLHKLGLLWRSIQAYVGYVLTVTGYDVLALNALAKKNIIQAIGRRMGVGKEADVYDAIAPSGMRLAVKFHRLGRVSFRQTRRYRTFVGERRHISWLYQSRLAAEKEYEALTLVHPKGVHAPAPIGHNRHVVVTAYFEGVPLYELRELPDPAGLLESLLEDMRIAYQEAGVVHGDLSEYNIIVNVTDDKQDYVIIDWPQWVPSAHPSADLLLRRDLEHLASFFRKRFSVTIDPEEALEYIKKG